MYIQEASRVWWLAGFGRGPRPGMLWSPVPVPAGPGCPGWGFLPDWILGAWLNTYPTVWILHQKKKERKKNLLWISGIVIIITLKAMTIQLQDSHLFLRPTMCQADRGSVCWPVGQAPFLSIRCTDSKAEAKNKFKGALFFFFGNFNLLISNLQKNSKNSIKDSCLPILLGFHCCYYYCFIILFLF